MGTTRIRHSTTDRVFLALNNAFLVFWFLVVFYPLLYVVNASFSAPEAIMTGRVQLWPVGFNLEGYKAVFQSSQVLTGYYNSFVYVVLGTSINIVLTIAMAYPLSRKDFRGRNAIMFGVTFTMLFSGGLIPTYLLVRDLGLVNTRWAMVLPNAIAVWNVIITRTYLQATIPDELLESAYMDGCGNIRFLVSIVLPLSKAIIAVIGLFYAVGHWNAFFNALIYLRDSRLYPLQIILRSILLLNQIDPEMMVDVERAQALEFMAEILKYSLIVVASVPVMLIYPVVQRHFVKGVMIGSLKG